MVRARIACQSGTVTIAMGQTRKLVSGSNAVLSTAMSHGIMMEPQVKEGASNTKEMHLQPVDAVKFVLSSSRKLRLVIFTQIHTLYILNRRMRL